MVRLKDHDLVGYRGLLNLQLVHMRGFPRFQDLELIPYFSSPAGSGLEATFDAVLCFLSPEWLRKHQGSGQCRVVTFALCRDPRGCSTCARLARLAGRPQCQDQESKSSYWISPR